MQRKVCRNLMERLDVSKFAVVSGDDPQAGTPMRLRRRRGC